MVVPELVGMLTKVCLRFLVIEARVRQLKAGNTVLDEWLAAYGRADCIST
jgi:hypothetical protein